MGGSTSTNQANLVVTNYKKEYLKVAAEHEGPHLQFVKWLDPIPEEGGWGGTLDWPVLGSRRPRTNALSEGVDVTPGSLKSYNVTLTAAEYGDIVTHTNLLEFKSRASIRSEYAAIMADSRRQSIDMVVRQSLYGLGATYPSQIMHIDGSGTMASLGGGDTITWEFFNWLGAQARQRRIKPLAGGSFATILPPLLVSDIRNTTQFQNAAMYSGNLKLLEGEVGSYGGFRIIESPEAKIYWGAGGATAANVSTTLNGNFNAGDTKIVLTAIGNTVAGTYLTIGTKETYAVSPSANLEQVQVVTVNPDGDNVNEVSIIGMGDGTNMGLAYDHATGEAITDTYNVAAIPVIGQNSLLGVFGSGTGKYGQAKYRDDLDVLGRNFYTGWYWYGGCARVDKMFMLGKVALSSWTIGCD